MGYNLHTNVLTDYISRQVLRLGRNNTLPKYFEGLIEKLIKFLVYIKPKLLSYWMIEVFKANPSCIIIF
jgi:hypothetical protein